MKKPLRVVLQATPEQSAHLEALQAAFADVCNALAPRVQETRCWNRVTLHHLMYKELRERFPQVGSQMTCNAIYSVCRTARAVFQNPASPFSLQRLGNRPLPTMHFLPLNPVYFDRHTLSLKGSELSLYTLEGRLRFRVASPVLLRGAFQERKLREVVLTRLPDGKFVLDFHFADEPAVPENPPERPAARRPGAIPDYVQVEAAA